MTNQMTSVKLGFTYLLVIFSLFAANAQKNLEKGYIKLEVTDVTAADEQMAAGLEMMKGTESEVYFDGAKSVTILNMMGGMVKMTNHLSSEGDMNMLMDAMGQKIHVETKKMEMEKMKAENPNPMSELEFAYDESDTKEVAGYKCFKMTGTVPGAEEPSITAYVTEEIDASAALIQGVDLEDFRGFPLEFTVSMQGMFSMTTSTKEIKDTINDESVFNLDTKGYQKMSMEEFMQSAGGGFGF